MKTRPQTRRFLPFLTWLNAAALLALWLLQFFIAERHWLTILLTYFPQVIFAVPTMMLLIASITPRTIKYLFINALVFLGVLWLFLGFQWNWVPLDVPGETLRIMTYNIHAGQKGVEGIVEQIREHNPDIVLLQEVIGWRDVRDPYPEFSEKLNEYKSFRLEERVIATKLPVVSQSVINIRQEGTRRYAQVVRLNSGGKEFSVVNVHFATSANANSLIRSSNSRRQYLSGTAKVRVEQLVNLVKGIDKLQGPVILGGDFNTPPRGRIYRRIAGRLNDSFTIAGKGFGYTFPAHFPLLRIDYIFTSPGIKVRRVIVPESKASDHRPVVADVIL